MNIKQIAQGLRQFFNCFFGGTDCVLCSGCSADYILTAAGGPIDSFWEYWAYHHRSPKVKTQLDALRIGFLEDWVDTTDKMDTPYSSDPHDERGPGQRVMMQEPWCTQTGAVDMNKGYFTANASFYVRNHTPVRQLRPYLRPFPAQFQAI